MNDYKKYLLRQMGLKEAQFIPSSLLEKDEFPGIDPDELEKGKEDEKGEHHMSDKKAELTAKQHLNAPDQAHYYTGLEKAKDAGMLKDQVGLSPTAMPTPIIAVGIRGSYSGGLPSGADQQGDISPTKVGGYDRVTPQNLNSKLVDKTPTNPEIQQSAPINDAPQTADGVTHPHQIQVTAHEEPQAATGASTDSDPTLKLKSAVPKGIDIDIAEQGAEEEEENKNEDNNTAMIPSTSLSETFDRHKRLMRERLFGLEEGKCPCGCEGTCQCPPDCKCRKNKNGVCECATCGCGDPTDTHGMEPQDEATDLQAKGVENAIAAAMQKAGGDKEKARQLLIGAAKAVAAKGSTLTSQLYAKAAEALGGGDAAPLTEGKHKAGCQCGFCKNKGSFGKKKKEEVEEGDEADSMSDQDQELQADRDFKKDKKKDKKDEKEKVDEAKCTGKADCMCKNCKEPDYEDYKKKKGEFKGIPMSELDPEDKIKFKKQQRLDESFAAPFQRMRSLAGIGNMILTSNGLFETKHEPGASKPFNTNWKMDKEKAGFVKIDEEKLSKIKATLERKSKRGTLSDKELDLVKKLNEVLEMRKSALDKQSQAVDKRFAKMEKDPKDRPFPFDRDDYVPGPGGKLVPHKQWNQLAAQGKVVTAK